MMMTIIWSLSAFEELQGPHHQQHIKMSGVWSGTTLRRTSVQLSKPSDATTVRDLWDNPAGLQTSSTWTTDDRRRAAGLSQQQQDDDDDKYERANKNYPDLQVYAIRSMTSSRAADWNSCSWSCLQSSEKPGTLSAHALTASIDWIRQS